MLFLSLNFISALFIDKTVLALTYHFTKHWSLEDGLGFFQLTASLRLWLFPQTGLRTCATITYTQNTPLLPLWLSALTLRLQNSKVAIEKVSVCGFWLGWSD